jgi:murein DD-endopeptidase / murein LD-carboxypeptidase
MDSDMIEIPERFRNVRYNGSNHPGAPVRELRDGANCQVFAYRLLEHYGLELPPFRSSELWADSRYTREVTEYAPLDLLLFHDSPDAFGAHVTVYVGEERVVHLAKHHGLPVIERVAQLLSQDRYRCLIGAKRVIGASP